MNPENQYCRCGYKFTPGLLMKIRLLIFDEMIWTCPQCGSRLKFKLIHHVVKIESENLDKKELWKRG